MLFWLVQVHYGYYGVDMTFLLLLFIDSLLLYLESKLCKLMVK